MESKMFTEKDIAVVVPSYNNLEYLKLLYASVRDASKEVQLILYADGCTDGTWEWMRTLPNSDINVMVFNQETRMGHTFLYDWGFQKTSRPIIGILHADMVVHSGFFQNILNRIEPNSVVCGTCVEPPLHPAGREKYIFNAGMYPDDFDKKSFNKFCETLLGTNRGIVQESIFAPWFLLREDYMTKIKSHDVRFAPYGYEDSDLFTRMSLEGFRFVQDRSALVYHFTQRGHKWTKGVGIENEDYQTQMNATRREYIRKFGTDPIFDELHCPQPIPKYDIGMKITNCNLDSLWLCEPFCSTLYVDLPENQINMYIKSQQTIDDLRKKIRPLSETPTNDIVVSFDTKEMYDYGTPDRESVEFIVKLPLIIANTVQQGDSGEFVYSHFTLNINQIREVSVL